MKIERYEDCTYEELMEAERELVRKQDWLNKLRNASRFPYWEFYKPGAEQINNRWKRASHWHIPISYIIASATGEFSGKYEISIHIRDNEDFDDFCKKSCKDRVSELLKKKKLDLRTTETYLRREIEKLNNEFVRKLDDLKDRLIIHIEKNAVKVKKYEPHYFGSEDGRNTRKMLELIGNANLAFRGVMCGSIYAYEWLIGNFVSEEVIDSLWESTTKILEKNKEYLPLQMALKYHKSNTGAGKKVSDDELLPYIKECLKKESFITSTGKYPGKIKHTAIAQHIFYNTEMFEYYEDDRQLRTRVKELLPNLGIVETRNGKYFKKRK